YLLLWDPRLLWRKASWLAALAVFAAHPPFWAYNLHHGVATFELLGRGAALAGSSGRGADLYWALTRGLPNVLGVRELSGEFSGGAQGFALALLAAVGAGGALIGFPGAWAGMSG